MEVRDDETRAVPHTTRSILILLFGPPLRHRARQSHAGLSLCVCCLQRHGLHGCVHMRCVRCATLCSRAGKCLAQVCLSSICSVAVAQYAFRLTWSALRVRVAAGGSAAATVAAFDRVFGNTRQPGRPFLSARIVVAARLGLLLAVRRKKRTTENTFIFLTLYPFFLLIFSLFFSPVCLERGRARASSAAASSSCVSRRCNGHPCLTQAARFRFVLVCCVVCFRLDAR